MTLDESTRRNLELTETMRGGDVKGSLLGVLDATLTPMGGRLLRRWLNQPLLDVDAINRRLDAVQLLHRRHACCAWKCANTCAHIGDLERWTNRVIQGIALPRDLVGMREVLRRVPELQADWGLGDLGTWASDELTLQAPKPSAPSPDPSPACPSPAAPKSSPSSTRPSPTSRRPPWRRRA